MWIMGFPSLPEVRNRTSFDDSAGTAGGAPGRSGLAKVGGEPTLRGKARGGYTRQISAASGGKETDMLSIDDFKAIVAAQLGVEVSKVTPTSRLVEDLHAESVDLARVVAEVEKKTGKSLENASFENVVTVADAYKAVMS
jgi:acyl carrier protein